jgi:hypothetical protein
MANIILLASFPNSRIESRSPTKTADTFDIDAGVIGGAGPTLTLSADENRTYAKMQEVSTALQGFAYFYATTQNVNPTVIPTFGVKFDLLWNPITLVLYQKQDDGVTTNWAVIVNSLLAFKSVSWLVPPLSATIGGNVLGIESLQDIYTFSLGGSVAVVNVESGEG